MGDISCSLVLALCGVTHNIWFLDSVLTVPFKWVKIRLMRKALIHSMVVATWCALLCSIGLVLPTHRCVILHRCFRVRRTWACYRVRGFVGVCCVWGFGRGALS